MALLVRSQGVEDSAWWDTWCLQSVEGVGGRHDVCTYTQFECPGFVYFLRRKLGVRCAMPTVRGLSEANAELYGAVARLIHLCLLKRGKMLLFLGTAHLCFSWRLISVPRITCSSLAWRFRRDTQQWQEITTSDNLQTSFP